MPNRKFLPASGWPIRRCGLNLRDGTAWRRACARGTPWRPRGTRRWTGDHREAGGHVASRHRDGSSTRSARAASSPYSADVPPQPARSTPSTRVRGAGPYSPSSGWLHACRPSVVARSPAGRSRSRGSGTPSSKIAGSTRRCIFGIHACRAARQDDGPGRSSRAPHQRRCRTGRSRNTRSGRARDAR